MDELRQATDAGSLEAAYQAIDAAIAVADRLQSERPRLDQLDPPRSRTRPSTTTPTGPVMAATPGTMPAPTRRFGRSARLAAPAGRVGTPPP